MPTSRRRPRNPNTRPRKRGVRSGLEEVNGVFRVKRNVFNNIKNDEDFAAMVRVGRLLNVLAHTMDSISGGAAVDFSEPLTLRNFTRTLFNTAGYIFEGYELIASLYPRYRHEAFFCKLANAYEDPDRPYKRKIMQLMRNAGAFHLDSDNKHTKEALSKLNLNKIDLYSSKDGTYGTAYFHLADTLDINYVIDELKETATEDEGEIYQRMGKLSVELLGEFLRGAA